MLSNNTRIAHHPVWKRGEKKSMIFAETIIIRRDNQPWDGDGSSTVVVQEGEAGKW